jgi:hypothetical protein
MSTYRTVLASVTSDAIDEYRACDADEPIVSSCIRECAHDVTATEIQPLGSVLAEALDTGQPLRNDGWHPLRAPIVVDPETVMARSMKLEQAWRDATPQLGGMMAEVLGADIDSVREVYAHASSAGEAVVSFLTAPDDDRAAKTLVPTVTPA